MDLADEELDEMHTLIFERLLYGEDEVVYGTTPEGEATHQRLSSLLKKVRDEAKRRDLWWAR